MGVMENFLSDLKATIIDTLRDLIREEINNQTTDKWLDVNELSEYWGVSKDWIYKNADRMPHTREGGLAFLRSEVDEWRKCESDNNKVVGIRKVSVRGYRS